MALGAMGSHLLVPGEAAFAAFLDLGQAARWEPAEIRADAAGACAA